MNASKARSSRVRSGSQLRLIVLAVLHAAPLVWATAVAGMGGWAVGLSVLMLATWLLSIAVGPSLEQPMLQVGFWCGGLAWLVVGCLAGVAPMFDVAWLALASGFAGLWSTLSRSYWFDRPAGYCSPGSAGVLVPRQRVRRQSSKLR